MKRWCLVAVCAVGLAAAGCDDDDGTKGGPDGSAGTGGARADAAAGTGGTTGGLGGTTGTGGTIPGGGDAGSDADVAGGGAGDTSSETGGGGGDTPNAPMSVMIRGAEGGELNIGDATLNVPAGALSSDVTLTVSDRVPGAGDPNAANILGNIYDFGPDGTVFSVPVALALPLDTVPANKDATVAWLDASSGQWFPVPSTVGDDEIVGLVSHFTSFAVLLTDKGAACPTPDAACGGSLDGTWMYKAACLKTKAPTETKCGMTGKILQRQDIALGGNVTIAGGRYTANQAITLKGTLFFTAQCLGEFNQNMVVYADCQTVQAQLRKENNNNQPWICSGTVEQGCSCVLSQHVDQTQMGSVTVAGNKVTFMKDGATEAAKPSDFCVKGNSLVVVDADGTVFSATKQ